MAGWTEKQYPTICCLQESHFSFKGHIDLRVKRPKKIFQTMIIIKRQE